MAWLAQRVISLGVGNSMLLSFGALHRHVRKTDQKPLQSTGGATLHTIMLPDQTGDTQDSMTIRLADNEGQRNRANMLLKRMYSWRGYPTKLGVPTSPDCV